MSTIAENDMDWDELAMFSRSEIDSQFFKLFFNVANTEIAITRTSVSTVRTVILLWPCSDISLTCRNTLVSAYSWLQGEMNEDVIYLLLVMQFVA